MKIFAIVSRPDGYFGDKCIVSLALKKSIVLELTSNNCWYRSPLPPVASIKEAIWLIRNHPIYREFYSIRSIVQ